MPIRRQVAEGHSETYTLDSSNKNKSIIWLKGAILTPSARRHIRIDVVYFLLIELMAAII